MARLMTSVRLEAGISQAELAKLMFTHQTVVAKWETGSLRPTIATLEKLAEVTGKRLEVRLV
jgi:transcriptional regulator with XRE-family HTH domain